MNNDITIGGLTTTDTENNVLISSSNLVIPFYADYAHGVDEKTHNERIRNVEMQVRTSKDYRAYIRYLKEELDPPLNHCMVYSNVTDKDAPIEMHHGVIFTLYDYVEIVINHCYKNNIPFSSSYIFHLVMKEHMLNNVQVIMLCEAAHKSVHPKKKGVKPRFLDYKMCHGDIVNFLEKYYDGLSFSHLSKLRNYFSSYEENMNKRTEDSKFFNEFISSWCKEVGYVIGG